MAPTLHHLGVATIQQVAKRGDDSLLHQIGDLRLAPADGQIRDGPGGLFLSLELALKQKKRDGYLWTFLGIFASFGKSFLIIQSNLFSDPYITPIHVFSYQDKLDQDPRFSDPLIRLDSILLQDDLPLTGVV